MVGLNRSCCPVHWGRELGFGVLTHGQVARKWVSVSFFGMKQEKDNGSFSDSFPSTRSKGPSTDPRPGEEEEPGASKAPRKSREEIRILSEALFHGKKSKSLVHVAQGC